jgi:uncharacterized glyoxalase superfamily protein PhnB
MTQGEATLGGVTPCLRYERADEALEWLARVLGFVERARYVDRDGIVRQAEMYVGDAEVWLSGHGDGYWKTHPRGLDQYLMVAVEDVDALYERVKAAGVDAAPPADQTWGVRSFHVTDPGGYHWGLYRRLPEGYRQVKTLEDGGLREIMKSASPPRPLDFDQIDLVVRDMEASIAFYRALGVEIPDTAVWRTPSGIHHVDVVLPGGVTLHLDSPALAGVYDRGWRAPSGPGTRVVLGFRVEGRDEVDHLHDKLMSLGHVSAQAPFDAFWGARYAVVEDPDGTHVGIMSASDPARRGPPPAL